MENGIMKNGCFPAEKQERISFSFSHFCLSPPPLFPLFVSPLTSLSGSSNGTYSSLKSPAKSCSEYDFVETGHQSLCTAGLIAEEERLQQLQSLPLPDPQGFWAVASRARREGRVLGRPPSQSLHRGLSRDRETQTLPWGLSQALG